MPKYFTSPENINDDFLILKEEESMEEMNVGH